MVPQVLILLPLAASQDFNLEITSKKDNERSILNKIDYQKTHKDSIGVIDEIQRISSFLKTVKTS